MPNLEYKLLMFRFNTETNEKEIDDEISNLLNDKFGLNICNACETWQNSENQMYWQGEEDTTTSDILDKHGYTAVCDKCFHKLEEQENN